MDTDVKEAPGYDPEACVTAFELRAAGIPVPDSIPDVAWIRHEHVKYNIYGVYGLDTDKVTVDIGVTFLSDFQWVKVDWTFTC